MLALTAAPGKPGNVDLREVADPAPHHNEALVRVKAISLNRGETRRLADMQDGERIGWDLAGVIEGDAQSDTGTCGHQRQFGAALGDAGEIVAIDAEPAAFRLG